MECSNSELKGNQNKLRFILLIFFGCNWLSFLHIEFIMHNMELNILTLCYLIGSVTFIIGLKMLSNPASARKGNLVAAAGMTIAILGTIFLYEEDGQKLGNYGWIFGGIAIGAVVGTLAAKKVKMTAMPEMVSMFNGMGGACAALISIVEFNHLAQ